MTRGFALLSNNDFTGARSSFQSARNILPAADGPKAALTPLEEAETLSRLNDLLAQAADLAAKEQWAETVEVLEAALAIDASLVEASDGLNQARHLAELFAKLDTIVEKQARLVDPVVLSEAQLSLLEAEAALAANAQTSPVLKDKVAAVRSAVATASTPLPVVITSDGLTEITIKRVARLGTVSSRTVSLGPANINFWVAATVTETCWSLPVSTPHPIIVLTSDARRRSFANVHERNQSESLSPTAFEPRSETTVATTRRITPAATLLVVAGLVIAYVLFFLLTARSVSVTVEAETTAAIDISGLHLPFGERFLMRPGSYELTVTAEGYRAYTAPLRVDDAEVQTQAVVLTPLPGTLVIESLPASATVSLGGIVMGGTPLTIDEIEAGEVTVNLVADRYLPYETTIEVTGRAQTQRFSASLTPGWARVSVETIPAEVSVSIDQQSVDRQRSHPANKYSK